MPRQLAAPCVWGVCSNVCRQAWAQRAEQVCSDYLLGALKVTWVQTMPPGFSARCMALKNGCEQRKGLVSARLCERLGMSYLQLYRQAMDLPVSRHSIPESIPCNC